MASIELENVSLIYPIYGINSRSLKASILNLAVGGRLMHEKKCIEVHSLTNISFSLKDGDRLGIIGHNGAGKTSLLKVLGGIYEHSSGSLKTSGTISCLFDIMMGMDHELTGVENILLRGLIMGRSKTEMKKLYNDIEEFADLGNFLKMPIKTYSAGMVLRLAFAIVTSVKSNILLIDELVTVGDANFMEKAKERISNLIRGSDILVLSTHDHSVIKDFCNKILWLDHGTVKFFGDISEIFSNDLKEHPLESLAFK